MARYYKRKSYTGYSYRNRYKYGSSNKRKAIGNYKAAIQQRDGSQVNININHQFSVANKIIAGTRKQIHTGSYALNIWDLLRKSEFYQSYSNMYDQVKIDGVKIKLTPIEWNTTNYSKAFTVVTAWDRSGLSLEQLYLNAANIDTNGENAGVVGKLDDEDYDGLYLLLQQSIGTYSSALTKNLNPGSSFAFTRKIYPSNMQEKSFFVPTSSLRQWYGKYDKYKCRYVGLKLDKAVMQLVPNESLGQDKLIGEMLSSPNVKGNPCYLEEDSTIPFKPTLLVGLISPAYGEYIDYKEVNGVVQTEGPIVFNLEADVQVTFRGLRKASIVV